MHLQPNSQATTLGAVATATTVPGSIVHTDGLFSYNGLAKLGYQYRPRKVATVPTGEQLLSRVHREISNLKAWMHGTPMPRVQTPLGLSARHDFTTYAQIRTSLRIGMGFEIDGLPTPALVHDYLLVLRGAERVFGAIADLWPNAPIHTLLFDPETVGSRFSGHPVHPSALRHTHLKQKHFRALMPLMPAATRSLDLSGQKLVISSTSAVAHRVRPDASAVHVCYCHAPLRYVWHERETALALLPRPLRPILRRGTDRWRVGDSADAQRISYVLANSRYTRELIARCWQRDSTVVYPPVEIERFHPGVAEDYFLVVGEIRGHKGTVRALEAARRAGRPIKVAGGGDSALARRYPEAEFLGRVGDVALADLYARARAVVVAKVEEFGITAVEAQASGRPVVALDAGGAAETVRDGETGILVPPGSPDALAEVLRDVDFDRFDPAAAIRNAQRFSPGRFRDAFLREVHAATATAPP